MRKIVLVFACALLALFSLPVLADSADTPVASDLTLEELMAPAAPEADTQAPADLDPLFGAQEMSPYCSANAPTCSVDRDCDAYCGGQGFGWCVWDHWSNCCGCYG